MCTASQDCKNWLSQTEIHAKFSSSESVITDVMSIDSLLVRLKCRSLACTKWSMHGVYVVLFMASKHMMGRMCTDIGYIPDQNLTIAAVCCIVLRTCGLTICPACGQDRWKYCGICTLHTAHCTLHTVQTSSV